MRSIAASCCLAIIYFSNTPSNALSVSSLVGKQRASAQVSIPADAKPRDILRTARQTRVTERRRLDIVIAHHDTWNLDQVNNFWLRFLAIPKVADMQPFVYVYCQNPNIDPQDLSERLKPIIKRGAVVHLDNVGREGRVFLHHIVNKYNTLADHTVFSQDLPDGYMEWGDETLLERTKELFRLDTGLLALGQVVVETCDDSDWPLDHANKMTTLMYQVHAMTTGRICPLDGFLAFLKGQFLASAKRIRTSPLRIYKELLTMLEAPEDHFIHKYHGSQRYKPVHNPFFGHVTERAWTLLMDCTNTSKAAECVACSRNKLQYCAPDACQCLDDMRKDGQQRASVRALIG